jgi:hypothetical protein
MTEVDRLKQAMSGVRDELSWFVTAGGAVSSDDAKTMIRMALEHVVAVEDLLVGELLPEWKPEPMDNNF